MKKILTVLLIIWTSTVFGQRDFQRHFDAFKVKGSTTIYDYNNKVWIFTNKQDADVATLPASTFKILNSLLALEYKAVQSQNEVFKWDGKVKTHLGKVIDAWNKDTDLKNAYKNSTIWFFEEVAKRIGRNRYKKTLKKIKYGNGNYSENGIDFWNFGDFAITPRNQINFLVKLYENRLLFSKPTVDKVKEIMISEQSETHTYRDKTGWTTKHGQDIGWWVGYVETPVNVYFFATRLSKDENEENHNWSKARKDITRLIIEEIEER